MRLGPDKNAVFVLALLACLLLLVAVASPAQSVDESIARSVRNWNMCCQVGPDTVLVYSEESRTLYLVKHLEDATRALPIRQFNGDSLFLMVHLRAAKEVLPDGTRVVACVVDDDSNATSLSLIMIRPDGTVSWKEIVQDREIGHTLSASVLTDSSVLVILKDFREEHFSLLQLGGAQYPKLRGMIIKSGNLLADQVITPRGRFNVLAEIDVREAPPGQLNVAWQRERPGKPNIAVMMSTIDAATLRPIKHRRLMTYEYNFDRGYPRAFPKIDSDDGIVRVALYDGGAIVDLKASLSIHTISIAGGQHSSFVIASPPVWGLRDWDGAPGPVLFWTTRQSPSDQDELELLTCSKEGCKDVAQLPIVKYRGERCTQVLGLWTDGIFRWVEDGSDGLVWNGFPVDACEKEAHERAVALWEAHWRILDAYNSGNPFDPREAVEVIRFFEEVTGIPCHVNYSFFGEFPDEKTSEDAAKWRTWYQSYKDYLCYDRSAQKVYANLPQGLPE